MSNRRGKFYKTEYVSSELLKKGGSIGKDIQPRWIANPASKPSQNIHVGFNAFAIRSEYVRQGLRYFSSKKDFMRYLEHTSLKKDTKEAYWKQYLERDALLAKGTYGNVRDLIYQEKYLRKLRERVAKDKSDKNLGIIYRAFSKLTPESFGDLASSGTLPEMTRYYISEDDEVFTASGEGSFEMIEAQLKKQGIDLNRYRYAGLRGINKMDESDAVQMIEDGLESGALRPRVSKKGKAYIPFVPKRYQDKALEYYFDKDENRDY